MTNWKIFKVKKAERWMMSDGNTSSEHFHLDLDEYIEYRDGYEKKVIVSWWNITPCGTFDEYIEIDLDGVKQRCSDELIYRTFWKVVPKQVVARRAMDKISSLSQEALATINDGISRMNRGEIREFEHRIEDVSGNKHQFIYRK